YVAEREQNVVLGIEAAELALAISDLEQGGGQELDQKIRAAHSSAMLAVNAFAPWRADPSGVPLMPSAAGLEFERKLPTGLGGQPPNLDVVIEDSDRVIAIESKCTEHLRAKAANFVEAYGPAMAATAHPSWLDRFESVRDDP